MSAWMVSRNHIEYMVRAALAHSGPSESFSWYFNGSRRYLRPSDNDAAADAAQMLWTENFRSYDYRYQDHDNGKSPEYGRFGRPFGAPEPEAVLTFNAADCYCYQSCEHPGWEESESFAFVQALRSAAWHSLPGYDDAAGWPID